MKVQYQDILIRVLPDHIANQIAAGEVIQRPASAVKELLENAVDAEATVIQLIIQDAGKSLVQVVDNGKGMSADDARLCFARHATSKISKLEDLFHIRTMGFRGEALASIAAVAEVELKTKRAEDENGLFLEVANSVIVREEPVAVTNGTSLAMKNLFFNVPARRNFLKSPAAEMRHIVEEFTRVALSFPEIVFTLHANNQQLYHLEAGSLKQRIVQLMGGPYNAKLVPVKEETDYLNISGFVGKPDTARKTRGDQYFFVNNRFIRSPYLHHAVMSAFQEMLPPDHFPLYVLFIDLDPQQLDVNVHPTKQEIKFEDEKIVYAFVQAAIRHALAQFSITPTLDFELDSSIQQLSSIQKPFTEASQLAAKDSSLFRSFTQKNQAHFIQPDSTREAKNWKPFYELPEQTSPPGELIQDGELIANPLLPGSLAEDVPLFQLLHTYIAFPSAKGFWLIHQQAAHERILYEQLQRNASGKPVATQKSMFPVPLDLSPAEAVVLGELLEDLSQVGFLLEPVGHNGYVIQGAPVDVTSGEEKRLLEAMLEEYKHFSPDLSFSRREKLIRSMAKQRAIKANTRLTEKEMRSLVTSLLACEQPHMTPAGHPTYLEFNEEQLAQYFGK